MAYVVSLEGFIPPPRYDAVHWATAQIQESTAGDAGPWTTLDTVTLSPVDADPANPQARNFTVTTANVQGWYRVVWADGSSNTSESLPAYVDNNTYQSSGVTFASLTSRLIAMSGVTATEAKARINQMHKRMVVDGEWIKASVTIGSTEVSEAVYELDPDIAQLLSLRVNGYGYERKSVNEIDDLNANDAYTVGRYRGFFAPEFSAAGTGQLRIYPTPTQAGQAITGRAIMLPPDLVNDSDYPSLPSDFHEDLVDGALATVLLRDDERLDDAMALEQRFKQRIMELRGRGKRRVGSGPARVKMTL